MSSLKENNGWRGYKYVTIRSYIQLSRRIYIAFKNAVTQH